MCLPVGGWYLLRALLNRVDETVFTLSSICSEEWVVVMVAWFYLGWYARYKGFVDLPLCPTCVLLLAPNVLIL